MERKKQKKERKKQRNKEIKKERGREKEGIFTSAANCRHGIRPGRSGGSYQSMSSMVKSNENIQELIVREGVVWYRHGERKKERKKETDKKNKYSPDLPDAAVESMSVGLEVHAGV